MNRIRGNKLKSAVLPGCRRVCAILFLLACSISGYTQENVVHTGEYIKINSGTDLYVLGSFDSRSTVALPVINQGVFHLQGSLIHNGTMNLFGATPNQGTLRFYGNPASNATITGGTNISLFHLSIDLTNDILGGGNVLLRKDGVKSYGNVRFLNGGFELDTNIFRLDYYVGSSGIIDEANDARPYISVMNTRGKIELLNYPFVTGANNDIRGMGISFNLVDPVGAAATLERRFDTLGVGHPAYNNINRTYSLRNPSTPAQFSNVKLHFLDPSETWLNPNPNVLNVYVSEDMGQVWRPKKRISGTNDSIVSSGSAQFMNTTNFSLITAATPCNSTIPLTVNQIITTVIPSDTLFNVTEALVCNPLNITARLYGESDPGSYIEWRQSGTNTYTPQSPQGYFEANALDTFIVRSTSIRGCIDSMEIIVISTVPADTDFTPVPSSVCLGSAINFSPTAAQVGTSSYHWDFDNGDTSVVYSPSYTYPAIGNYDVNFTITTQLGCIYSESNTVTVKDIPTASFIAGAACPGAPISFDNNSYVAGYTGLVSLSWNFGDAGTGVSTGNSNGSFGTGDITHTYASEGTYPVTLVASANGCTSVPVVVNVTVYPEPVAGFTVSNACEGQNTAFTNNTTISDASALAYLWDFTAGGGPTSNTANPTYAYPANGNYNVSLIVTSINGCKDTVIVPITIYDNPVAEFNFTNACVNNPASFADVTPIIVGSTPYSYSWTFGDGNTGNVANETNAYASPGTYPVTMIVTTSNGCVGSVTHSVVAYPGPSVSFTAINACVNTPVSFINTSTNATTYSWNIPILAVTTSTTNTTQSFPTAGTHPVILAATSSNGCQDTLTGSITIYPQPAVNLGGNISTCGTSYLLNADPGGTIAAGGGSFAWNTGATTATLNATYNGTFTVTATTGSGCSASSSATVTLNANVVPTLGSTTVFCDSATLDAGYPGSTYSWNTGATTQTIFTTNSGTYSVTVTDQNSCVGSSNITITVVPSTPVNLGPNNQSACDDSPITLNAGIASSYLWSDGSTSSTLVVPSSGYYWVQNTNAGGCNSTDTVYVNYLTSPTVNLGNDQIVCDQTVLNAFTPNASYLWSTGDTTTSIQVTTSNTYIVTITDNTTTCDNSDTVNVTVNPLPIVNLGNDFNICSYATGTIDAGNPGATYQWNSGQTTQVITVASSGNYLVTVTDGNGCSSNDNITVTQLPLFAIDLGPDRQYCDGSTIILDPGLTTTGNTYLWEDESTTLGTGPTYQVLDTGMHYLTVTDASNCVATDSVNITPSNISLHAFFLVDSDIINGEQIVCVNLSYPRPYTSEWYQDNIIVSTDSTPTLTINIALTPPSDTVYVKLKVDNQFCQSEITKPIVVNSAFMPPSGGDGSATANTGLFNSIRNSLLYPNPTTGAFNLYVDLIQEAPVEFSIFSITGALLHMEKHTISTTVLPFDMSHLETGIYFIQIRVNKEVRTHKFIVIQN